MKASPLLASLLLLPTAILATAFIPSSSTASPASSQSLSLPSASSALPPPASTIITTAPTSRMTTPPSLDDVSLALQQKWHATTYWSCATFPNGYAHCGWHEPVLPGGDEIAGARGKCGGAGRAGVVAVGVMVVGALLG